jgi:hypothetical protein
VDAPKATAIAESFSGEDAHHKGWIATLPYREHHTLGALVAFATPDKSLEQEI